MSRTESPRTNPHEGVKPEEAMGATTPAVAPSLQAGESKKERLIEIIAMHASEKWRIRLVIEGRPVSVAYAVSMEGILNKNLEEADDESVRDLKGCVVEEVNVYER
jgi:hypothetical protein